MVRLINNDENTVQLKILEGRHDDVPNTEQDLRSSTANNGLG